MTLPVGVSKALIKRCGADIIPAEITEKTNDEQRVDSLSIDRG